MVGFVEGKVQFLLFLGFPARTEDEETGNGADTNKYEDDKCDQEFGHCGGESCSIRIIAGQ